MVASSWVKDNGIRPKILTAGIIGMILQRPLGPAISMVGIGWYDPSSARKRRSEAAAQDRGAEFRLSRVARRAAGAASGNVQPVAVDMAAACLDRGRELLAVDGGARRVRGQGREHGHLRAGGP